MNEFLNYTIISYDIWEHLSEFVIGLLFSALAMGYAIRDWIGDQKLGGFRWVFITLAVIGLGISTLGGIMTVERRNWSYAFDEQEMCLFDLSHDKNHSEQSLIRCVLFSELTPYFSYRDTLNDQESSNKTYVELRLEDDTIFFQLKERGILRLIRKYRVIHERNPELLNRMVVLRGLDAFESLASSLE